MRWGWLLFLSAVVALLPACASAAPQTCERALESGDGGRHYYMAFEDTVGEAGWRVDYTLTRLPAGEIRVKKWTIEKMLHGLDYMRSAYGQGPLPWGTKVVMRVKVVLAVDDDLSNDERTIQAETRDFLFALPTTPIK